MDNFISKNESLALRGICITLIVLHNLIHNVIPFYENEKWFNAANAEYFQNNIINHPILGIISYLGWLGVPMFFFLSGYGLKKKYGNIIPNKIYFIKNHYLKLLFLFGPIIIINNLHAHTPIYLIVGQLSFLDPIHRMVPAAFWYVVCAFEFYLLYAILLHKIKPKRLVMAGVIICLSLLFLDDVMVKAIKYHSIGWFFCFSFGCYVAAQSKCLSYIEKTWVAVLLFVLLAFSTINKQMWVFSDVLMILFLLSVRRFLNVKGITIIGTFSAFLYAVHPIVRNLWLYWKLDYSNGNVIVVTLSVALYFFACLLAAYSYRFIYIYIETYIKGKINGKNEP